MYTMLSLDISTTDTGYAVWVDGVYKRSDILRRTTKQSETENVLAMGRMLLDLLEEIEPDHIAIENTYAASGFNSSRNLDRLHGIVMAWAIVNDAYIDYIYIAEWRKYLGFPASSTLKKQGIKSPSRWYKKRSVAYAKEHFKEVVSDDNEADAICIGEAVMLRFQKESQNIS